MLNSVGTVNEVFKERGISIPLENHTSATEKTVMKKDRPFRKRSTIEAYKP